MVSRKGKMTEKTKRKLNFTSYFFGYLFLFKFLVLFKNNFNSFLYFFHSPYEKDQKNAFTFLVSLLRYNLNFLSTERSPWLLLLQPAKTKQIREP